MTPRIHLTPHLFIITLVLVTVIRFPAVWCQDTQRPYEDCDREIECGNVKLEYPFWGLDRPAYCGHPGFQITCQSDVPQLLNQSVDYRVLDADSSTQRITVARNDLWDTLCPRYLYNTTYNTALFNDNNFRQENVSLFYGCSTSLNLPGARGSGAIFSCTINGTESDNYFIESRSIAPTLFNPLVQCSSYITVPVNQTWADRFQLGIGNTDDLTDALKAGFNLGWTAKNDECDQCIQTQGRCGSNETSPELFACHCSSGSFSLTCDNRSASGEEGSKKTARKLIIGFSCGFAGILLLLFVILCRKKRLWETRKDANHKVEIPCREKRLKEIRKYENHKVETFIKNYGTLALKRFDYSEIKKITNSFVEILGKGGYGSVYKGQLPNGQLVAVKLLAGTQGDGEDFINEVASIGRTSHVNIVTLLGFCIEGKKRALMYELMPNGSLDKFLRRDGSHLDCNTLFQIAKGIARGLEYLHRGCNTRIVHFDIKPHNILLDEEFVPKISDFGLAKLCKRKESIVSVMGARGTAGYMAPEVFFRSFGGASHKSDVYSYGMMVLEMAGAHKKNKVIATSTSEAYFPDWVYKQIESGSNLGDPGVITTEYEEELARKMMMVSLWCIQSDPTDRPSISKVVEMLEGSFESLQAPPRRFWSSPSRPAQDTSPSAMQSSSGERLSRV